MKMIYLNLLSCTSREEDKDKKVDAIIVEFNSISSPDVYHAGASLADKTCGSNNHVNYDENLFGIKNLSVRSGINNKWNMITIVVSETTAEPNNVFLSAPKVSATLVISANDLVSSALLASAPKVNP